MNTTPPAGASALAHLESEARRFAGFYPECSDGRNAFEIFADKITALRTTGDAQPDAQAVELLREAMTDAFTAGATSVHDEWLENPGEAPRGDPEFYEAASDYALANFDTFLASQKPTP